MKYFGLLLVFLVLVPPVALFIFFLKKKAQFKLTLTISLIFFILYFINSYFYFIGMLYYMPTLYHFFNYIYFLLVWLLFYTILLSDKPTLSIIASGFTGLMLFFPISLFLSESPPYFTYEQGFVDFFNIMERRDTFYNLYHIAVVFLPPVITYVIFKSMVIKKD